ncbi:single-stranded DNA-binding protein [Demequina sp. NBRC 110053]|uniref:single-stranded DNA-binding protein n=1 Tax=Demequina sp. NBRC 110053 TaxID=1570342 RepID=UPI0009FC7C22|nr:single-stranded DNA-binding protein [Demequina sp. NBRC 110053]
MNDLTVTVTGWVATDPVLHSLGENKGKVCAFRMGHTPRYRDGDGIWRDGDTEWLAIRVFRAGSQNVGESIHKGQPVVVHGRLRSNIWTTNDGVERTELQLDASAVGHDLTKGTARFTRQVESASATSRGEDEDPAVVEADEDQDAVDGADAEPRAEDAEDGDRAAVLA